MTTSSNNSGLSRRSFLRAAALLGGAAAVGASAACGSKSATTASSSAAAGSSSAAGAAAGTLGSSLDEIITLAKEEGKVQLIAYPDDWANYRGHFKAFKEKYGVDTPVQSPDMSSAEELQTVKNLKGQPNQPDVLDIGFAFTGKAISGGLVQPYKPSTWDDIPEALKDPEGNWVGAYYGALSIGTNTNIVEPPQKITDLLDPKYKGLVALPGDPRTGASSIATVFAASLANGGSLDDITPGIEFFAELAKVGNLVAISDVASAFATKQAAVIFDWNYNLIGIEEQMKKDGVALVHSVPTDGIFGNYYAQPLTADCPQPNAGALWIEWLNSDEGAEQYALGGAVPARFPQLAKEGKLSDEALAMLPSAEVLEKITFPTLEQGEKAGQTISTQWAQKVKL